MFDQFALSLLAAMLGAFVLFLLYALMFSTKKLAQAIELIQHCQFIIAAQRSELKELRATRNDANVLGDGDDRTFGAEIAAVMTSEPHRSGVFVAHPDTPISVDGDDGDHMRRGFSASVPQPFSQGAPSIVPGSVGFGRIGAVRPKQQ